MSLGLKDWHCNENRCRTPWPDPLVMPITAKKQTAHLMDIMQEFIVR